VVAYELGDIALSEARMEGAKALIFHVIPSSWWKMEATWRGVCEKMKAMLESSRAFLHGKKLIFLQETLSVTNMIPDNLPHLIYDKALSTNFSKDSGPTLTSVRCQNLILTGLQ